MESIFTKLYSRGDKEDKGRHIGKQFSVTPHVLDGMERYGEKQIRGIG